MRTFIGWVLASKDYTDREQVPETKNQKRMYGAVQSSIDKERKSVNATTSNKHSDADFQSKKKHMTCHTDKWYKVGPAKLK